MNSHRESSGEKVQGKMEKQENKGLCHSLVIRSDLPTVSVVSTETVLALFLLSAL